MNPKYLIPLVVLAFIVMLSRGNSPKTESVDRKARGPVAAVELPAARKSAAPVAKILAEPAKPRAHFRTREEIKKLEAVIVDVSDTIDPDKRSEAFKQSGLDTPEHLASAVSIVQEPYAEPMNDQSVYLRMLALHYLSLTSRLDIASCTALLDGAIHRYETGADELKAKPYLWDAHDIAQTCTRIDSRTMVEYQRAQTNPKMGAQLKLVLKTEGVL
jgi:hypothetical protein